MMGFVSLLEQERTSLVVQMVKNLPTMWETQVLSLSQEGARTPRGQSIQIIQDFKTPCQVPESLRLHHSPDACSGEDKGTEELTERRLSLSPETCTDNPPLCPVISPGDEVESRGVTSTSFTLRFFSVRKDCDSSDLHPPPRDLGLEMPFEP